MPYQVADLMQGRPAPVTVRRESTAMEALDLMVEHDFSQLPVVAEDGSPVGMATYEGILRGVRNFRVQLDDLRIRDVITPMQSFRREDSLFDLLEQLKATNAVLIVDSVGCLVGIVTSYDSTEYFRNQAEDLMHVEDIELMIKELVKLPYQNAEGEIDEVRLAEAIAKIGDRENGAAIGNQLAFEELTLNQYIAMLVSRHAWPHFESILGLSRSAVRKLLEDVRDTRNDLAHFRKGISAFQADQLRFCAAWLARCRDEYAQKTEKLREERTAVLVHSEQGGQDITNVAAPAHAEEIPSVEVVPVASDAAETIAEEPQPTDSRYAPLADWLSHQPRDADSVKLSFQNIESIIGGDLPMSAYRHRAWWSNDVESHPQSRIWLEAGWRTSYLNMTDKRVTFVRIRERETAYIDFFGKLLTELRQQANFPIRDASPDGQNWIVCRTINVNGLTVGQFNYSFARGKRFRVELYLDAFDQDKTKQIFDWLYLHKETLEAELGTISWERIDTKRASRIAQYRPGDIAQSEVELTKLRHWAAKTMVAFCNSVEPLAIQASQEVLDS